MIKHEPVARPLLSLNNITPTAMLQGIATYFGHWTINKFQNLLFVYIFVHWTDFIYFMALQGSIGRRVSC